ncbi:unnamed protein product [Protopolystoma xenopodis]|uniref:Uncharacterized protein n=1 Tax=Protopolystoma xenopodis TaxID=117903 RepID=A0A3S5A7A7_9PLAT|nr:unnamed protein product [Protopolystoma xenopodis]
MRIPGTTLVHRSVIFTERLCRRWPNVPRAGALTRGASVDNGRCNASHTPPSQVVGARRIHEVNRRNVAKITLQSVRVNEGNRRGEDEAKSK